MGGGWWVLTQLAGSILRLFLCFCPLLWCSFVRSFVRLCSFVCVRSFVFVRLCSFVCVRLCSFVRSFVCVRSFVRSFVRSLVRSVVCLVVCLFVCSRKWLTRLLACASAARELSRWVAFCGQGLSPSSVDANSHTLFEVNMSTPCRLA